MIRSGDNETHPVVTPQMKEKDKKQDRLAELCARAFSESDPEELIALFSEINDILWKHILHVNEVVKRQQAREKLLQGPRYLM